MTDATAPPASSERGLTLVIGVGNEHRRDDRSGLDVVRALRGTLDGRARFTECSTDGIALLDLWHGAESVVIVDAVRSGARPGTVLRLEANDPALGSLRSPTSTHGLSVGEAVALAKGLGCLPPRLVVYGIEAFDVDVGTGLSDAVAHGVEEATDRISRELSGGLDRA